MAPLRASPRFGLLRTTGVGGTLMLPANVVSCFGPWLHNQALCRASGIPGGDQQWGAVEYLAPTINCGPSRRDGQVITSGKQPPSLAPPSTRASGSFTQRGAQVPQIGPSGGGPEPSRRTHHLPRPVTGPAHSRSHGRQFGTRCRTICTGIMLRCACPS